MRRACIALFLAAISLIPCGADPSFVDALASAGRLAIPIEEARVIESRLGQLFIVNVDGFGYAGPLALEPGFASMVKRLQIGGVIPHYGSTSYERIRRTNRALAMMTRLPLLLCSDIVKISAAGVVGTLGDGYVGGFLGKFRRLPDPELATLARLNGFVLAALGINVALGPTVDSSTADPRTPDRARIVVAGLKEFGLEPVLKHFPYLPAGINLHRQSPDTRVPPEEAEERAAVFHELAGEAGIMMTTHLYDSLVDRSIVTFSPVWNELLRSQTGFGGLLMSDGLLMLRNYADRSVLSGGPSGPELKGIDRTAVWALRAILAGHDLIIVEGSASQTYRAFQGLLTVACGDTTLCRMLRARIDESCDRIERWKKEREDSLRRIVDVPAAVIDSVIRILPGDDDEQKSFRFDAQALARLDHALRAARRQ